MLASSPLSTQTISNNPLPRNWRVASFPKRATIRCASLTGKTSLGWFYGLFTGDLWECSMVMTYALFDLFGGWILINVLMMCEFRTCCFDGWMDVETKNFKNDLINHRLEEMKPVMKWRTFLLLFLVNHGSPKTRGIQFEMSSYRFNACQPQAKCGGRWKSIPIKENMKNIGWQTVGKGVCGVIPFHFCDSHRLLSMKGDKQQAILHVLRT